MNLLKVERFGLDGTEIGSGGLSHSRERNLSSREGVDITDTGRRGVVCYLSRTVPKNFQVKKNNRILE